MIERRFFKVSSRAEDAPLRDYLLHGYEERQDFYLAVRQLVERWKGRVGESVGERHGFHLLRFHDTPGGLPDEAWLPSYLLKPTEMPSYLVEPEPPDEFELEVDRAIGLR